MTCGTCRWWDGEPAPNSLGLCRRFPPFPVPTHDGVDYVVSQTYIDEGCGEHAPRATTPVAPTEGA